MNYTMFDYRRAMPSPWGKVDTKHKICAGVYDVGTPSHGGIMVGKSVARRLLSEKAQKMGEPFNNYLCYEEDCKWAFFAFEQPQLYADSFRTHAIRPNEITTERMKERARRTLEAVYPEYFNR